MEEKRDMLIMARDEIESYIRAFEAREKLVSKEIREKDARRIELLKFILKEVDVLIPNSTLFSEGRYYCPMCKSEVGAIYAAADDVSMPVNFCPCCGQAFNGRIGVE